MSTEEKKIEEIRVQEYYEKNHWKIVFKRIVKDGVFT